MNKQYSTKDQGFTLIEVLVAALVMGIGLLGILTLQSKTLQFNQQAYLYSQASFLVSDMADRMRANPDVNYETDFDDPITGVADSKCVTGVCNSNELVQWDLHLWKSALAGALPEGDGAIKKVGNQHVITVQFDDSRGESDTPGEVKITIQI